MNPNDPPLSERMPQRTANQLATSAPGTITIKDQTLLVNQPTRADFVTLAKHLKSLWKQQHTSILQDTVKELKDIPAEYHKDILGAAVQYKQTAEPTQENLNDMLLGLPGTRFWVWHLCRPNHPELPLSQFETLIDESNHATVLSDLFEATDMSKIQPPN